MSVKKAGNKRIVLCRPLFRRLPGYFCRTPGSLPVRRHLIFFSFHIILVRRRSNSCSTRVGQGLCGMRQKKTPCKMYFCTELIQKFCGGDGCHLPGVLILYPCRVSPHGVSCR